MLNDTSEDFFFIKHGIIVDSLTEISNAQPGDQKFIKYQFDTKPHMVFQTIRFIWNETICHELIQLSWPRSIDVPGKYGNDSAIPSHNRMLNAQNLIFIIGLASIL